MEKKNSNIKTKEKESSSPKYGEILMRKSKN